jgi:cytochrome oxidase Cu insertion factor (SCO1/SenC/PrrC family)
VRAQQHPATERRRSRWVLVSLFAVVASPVIAAFGFYFFWTPAGGVNYGHLLGPRPAPDITLTAPDGSAWRLSSLRGSWVLLHVGSGRCDDPCAKRLFAMRQARLMLGRDAGRVERVWMVDDEVVPEPNLLRGYEGMRVAQGAHVANALALEGRNRIYVVDPLGNVMLTFPSDPDPRAMYRDLARLLNVSHVG